MRVQKNCQVLQFFFAVNVCTKKFSSRVIFFSVMRATGLHDLPQKKLHNLTIFLLHAFTAKKKNYTNYNIHKGPPPPQISWGHDTPLEVSLLVSGRFPPPGGGGRLQSDGSPPGGRGAAPEICTIVSQCKSASAPCKNFLWRLVFPMLSGPQ